MTTEFTTTEQKVTLFLLLESLNVHLENTLLTASGQSFFENSRLEDRDFVKGLKFDRAYYDLNNNLCLVTNKGIVIILNISDETITIKKTEGILKTEKMLMPLKMLWFAFEAHRAIKGKTKYYEKCYSNSCIRHLYDIDMDRYGWKEKMDKMFHSTLEQELRFELN